MESDLLEIKRDVGTLRREAEAKVKAQCVDCPARVPNLGPGCEGAREESVGEICADEGRGFPRGVSAEADSDDSMTARASASDNRVARAVESCCGSAGPARRSGAATSESPHLGSRSGEQPREYAAGRVGSSARQRRNAPVRAAGRTAARLARGAASPMGRRGLRLGPRGREDCGRGSRRGGARCTPEQRGRLTSSQTFLTYRGVNALAESVIGASVIKCW